MKKHIFTFLKIFTIILIIIIHAYSLFRWYNSYDMKYFIPPSFQNNLEYTLIVVFAVTLCMIMFLFQKKLRRKWMKIFFNVVCLMLVLSSFFVEGFILSTWVHKSQSCNPQDYLQFDYSIMQDDDYIMLLPTVIPPQAQNIEYDYQWRIASFLGNGSYVYASWSLPKAEYICEKQRVANIAAVSDFLSSSTGNKQIYYYPFDYILPEKTNDAFEITFNDVDYTVSYFRAINCYWNNNYRNHRNQLEDGSAPITNQGTVLYQSGRFAD
ncbi:MAG: hypothetical protein IJA02_08705 [Clostridia bacterium]|nr:hypothetical protein [Clostridia bacterium]